MEKPDARLSELDLTGTEQTGPITLENPSAFPPPRCGVCTPPPDWRAITMNMTAPLTATREDWQDLLHHAGLRRRAGVG